MFSSYTAKFALAFTVGAPDHTMVSSVTRYEVRIEQLLLKRAKAGSLIGKDTDGCAFADNRHALVGSLGEAPLQQNTANSTALPTR